MQSLELLNRQITACERCERLRTYCGGVAQTKRRAYLDWDYWGKPVPGFGDPNAWLWIVGLAPGAHGANRTGRVFTGDRSGDFLFAALHRAKLANQSQSQHMEDGLQLSGCYISAAVRCAPPGNKPLPIEQRACLPFMQAEWKHLAQVRVILALGKFAWDSVLGLVASMSGPSVSRVAFSHGASTQLDGSRTLVGSYHVSQQNTFTGKLTAEMFDRVLDECACGKSCQTDHGSIIPGIPLVAKRVPISIIRTS